MSEAQQWDELIEALKGILEVAPDGAALRLLLDSELDDYEMSAEEFINFTRDLLFVAKKIRKKK